ncbi:DUF885 family protein [Nannocystaceae bacterium ST9]
MSTTTSTDLAAAAWRRHLEFEPEEARMLGLPGEGRKSLRRLDAQLDLYRGLARAPEPEVGPGLQRLARLALRRFERGEEHAGLERVLLPRLTAMPDAEGFVGEHLELLREGLRRGSVAPLEVAEHFGDHELPAIAARVEPGSAWHELLGFVRDELIPAARALGPDRWRLGEDEYAWRVANMGVAASPRAIAEDARTLLREQQARIVELLGVADFAAALPRLREITSERLGPGEVVPLHRAATRRCVAFVRERGLFDLPADFEVPITHVAPELASVTHAGNVPAPLFGEGGGSFTVLDVPDRHRRAWIEPLAVHEGVPGHYLQSWLWQRLFRARGAAPSFVSFADVTAAERQDWGAMLAIEGWAVYAEDLMLRAGFHAPLQAVAVASFHSIRCARACIDVGLHTQAMSREAAVGLLVDEVGLDRPEAEREVLRSIRVPTQPLAYFAGWRAIARLVEASGLSLADAHQRLLECGPALPRSLE